MRATTEIPVTGIYLSLWLLFAWLSLPHQTQGEEVVISQFTTNGNLMFEEVPNAINYRIEWSPNVVAGWTNFTGDYGQWLDYIPATGNGVITAAVPMFYRIVATIPPSNMVYMPSGTFMMGHATNVLPFGEGAADELPQHEVYIDALYVDKYEFSSGLWNTLTTWDYFHGMQYSFTNLYSGGPDNYPRRHVNWYDSVKMCNLRSEYEGLTPVYYTDENFTNIYRSGEITPYVDWSANGFRLPTEAEWEKAARGGQPDLRYPWSDTTNEFSYAKANANGHPTFCPGPSCNPSPVGYFPPNDYGLYDMGGNVMEWVWDAYDASYYSNSPTNNPHGPTNGFSRIARGGDYAYNTPRVAARVQLFPDGDALEFIATGFRCVRRP